MLSDMEESLRLIRNPVCKGLMQDAYKAYSVGILRASVLFTYLAVFHHIREELKFDKELIKIKVSSNGEISEKALTEQLGSNKIINQQETNFLNDLIYKRNQCAHMSDFLLTREDVRYLYHNSIELFLKHNIISGYRVVGHFIDYVRDHDKLFYRKDFDASLSVIRNHLNIDTARINASLYKIIYDVLENPETTNSVKTNIVRVVYVICKEKNEIFKYFVQESLKGLPSSKENVYKILYAILLVIYPEFFITEAKNVDKENFLRIFPELLKNDEIRDSLVPDVLGTLRNVEKIDEDLLCILIEKETEINPQKVDIFEHFYNLLNKMDFNTIDKYLPKWRYVLGKIAESGLWNSEQCYKIYLRLIKNNLVLKKEGVIRISDPADFYKNLREKASKFIITGQAIDLDEILFSSQSYSRQAKNIDSGREIWDRLIKDYRALCEVSKQISEETIDITKPKILDLCNKVATE